MSHLKEDVTVLQDNMQEVKGKLIIIETSIENEIKKGIGLLAENHIRLHDKLSTLKEVDIKITKLNEEFNVLKTITLENSFEIKALKQAR